MHDIEVSSIYVLYVHCVYAYTCLAHYATSMICEHHLVEIKAGNIKVYRHTMPSIEQLTDHYRHECFFSYHWHSLHECRSCINSPNSYKTAWVIFQNDNISLQRTYNLDNQSIQKTLVSARNWSLSKKNFISALYMCIQLWDWYHHCPFQSGHQASTVLSAKDWLDIYLLAFLR